MAVRRASTSMMLLLLLLLKSKCQEAGHLHGDPTECWEDGGAHCDGLEHPGVGLLQHRQSLEKRPNILLVVLDQWRADFDGFGEARLELPNVRSLAEEGLRFSRAYTASPACLPSRAALVLGREFQHSPVKSNFGPEADLVAHEERRDAFPRLLRDAGYLTILTGKDFTSGRGSADVEMRSVGFDLHLGTNDKYRLCNKSFPCDYSRFLQARGHFTEYCHSIGLHGRGHSCNSTPVCDNHDDEECGFRCEIPSAPGVVGVDEWTRQSAQDLLDQHWRGSGRPFFVQVNFPSPHAPLDLPAEKLTSRNGDQSRPIDAASPYHWQLSEHDSSRLVRVPKPSRRFENFTQSRASYVGVVELLDSQMGHLLDYLRNTRALQNTMVFVTADHGEHLGDHGEWGKSSPWEVSLRVPLIAAGPGILPGRVETAPVSLIDLAATFLELGGLEVPEKMDSHSLVPALLGSGPPTRQVVLSGLKDIEHARDALQQPAFFEVAASSFNASSLLKLVCCPNGCIKQGSLLPVTLEPQVALMNVSEGHGAAKFEHDILNKPPGRGVAEALHLLQFLSNESQAACFPVLRALSHEPSHDDR